MQPKRLVDDWLDSYMTYVDNSEPPDSYKRWVAISVIAGALQRKCRLSWGLVTFFPNMYIVLVSPPGEAKKGTAMAPGRAFLEDLNIHLAAESITREALIETVMDAASSYTDTETGKLMFHSSLTVFSPELTVFLGNQNLTLMSDLTDWFDCAKKWTYRTKNSGTYEILGMWVNLIGATTPDLIRTALPLDAIGGGLTSRIIFIYEPTIGKKCPMPFLTPKEVALRVKLMQDLETIHAMQGEFKVTRGMMDMWVDWYMTQADKRPFDDPRFAGYMTRRPVHAMSLAMICSASRSSNMKITEADFTRGLSFLTAAERKMPRAFSGVGKEKNADTMTSLMNEIALRKRVSAGDLLGMFLHDLDGDQFERMIRTLETIRFIKLEIGGDFGDSIIHYRGESTASINDAISATMGGDK